MRKKLFMLLAGMMVLTSVAGCKNYYDRGQVGGYDDAPYTGSLPFGARSNTTTHHVIHHTYSSRLRKTRTTQHISSMRKRSSKSKH